MESALGGSGVDTLVSTVANTWNITGSNAGTLNTSFAFSGIENLTGGNITNVTGGAGGDLLVGDGGANSLRGGGGRDVLWNRHYCCDPHLAGEETKVHKPLSEARIEVREVKGKPGWYEAVAWLLPHFQLETLTTAMRLVAEVPRKG